MKKLIAGLLLTASTLVHANCMTSTYFVNGRVVMCTTCCYGGICNTTCF
jgi:hypothetical protein